MSGLDRARFEGALEEAIGARAFALLAAGAGSDDGRLDSLHAFEIAIAIEELAGVDVGGAPIPVLADLDEAWRYYLRQAR